MKSPIQPRGSEQFALRLPPGLRERIAEHAKRRGRSMNSEIVGLLEAVYPEPTSNTELVEKAEKVLAEIARRPNKVITLEVRSALVEMINAAQSGVFQTKPTPLATLQDVGNNPKKNRLLPTPD